MKWFESDIDVVNIDGTLYALNGWNGERWMHCWRCLDEYTAADEDCAYEIAPVYDWSKWNDDAGEFQDEIGNSINGIIGYEVL